MIFKCPECGYEQTNEEFNLCPVCVDSEKTELQASAAEAHLHIDALHAVIKTGDLKTAELLINDWEANQCPF